MQSFKNKGSGKEKNVCEQSKPNEGSFNCLNCQLIKKQKLHFKYGNTLNPMLGGIELPLYEISPQLC